VDFLAGTEDLEEGLVLLWGMEQVSLSLFWSEEGRVAFSFLTFPALASLSFLSLSLSKALPQSLAARQIPNTHSHLIRYLKRPQTLD